jgi:hypothetical protein
LNLLDGWAPRDGAKPWAIRRRGRKPSRVSGHPFKPDALLDHEGQGRRKGHEPQYQEHDQDELEGGNTAFSSRI